MVKKNCIKKSNPSTEKPEANTLEKEIEEMIDREKTMNRIVIKLLNQTIPPTE
jgi:hypothetical protein